MKTVETNINYNIYVKLTEAGRNELRKQHDELRKEFPSLRKYEDPDVDKDGYSKFQMHSLMQSLGHMCGIGFVMPFETHVKIEVG
jgi:hypothetical protein